GDPASSSSSVSNELLERIEEHARRFFAGTQNPFLARVVQYNSLYQIFKRYHLRSSFLVLKANDEAVIYAPARVTKESLLALGRADKKTLSAHLGKLLSTEPEATR